MTTDRLEVAPLWSVPLSAGGSGLLTADPAGGCVVSVSGSLQAFTADGDLRWRSLVEGTVHGGEPVITPDATLVRIEGGVAVSRALDTGAVVGSFPTPRSSGLCLAPWGDLLFSQAAPQGVAAVHCVTRAGGLRWSAPLDDSTPLVFEPSALADLVVLERRGALWAYDRDGRVAWLADIDGVRPSRPEDEAGRSTDEPGSAVRITDAARLDQSRIVYELGSYRSRGVYLLDGGTATLTPVAVPSPAFPPYAVMPWPATGYRIAGLGAQVSIGQQLWEFPVRAVEPGGARVWEHRLPVRALALAAAPGGQVVATATPDARRWADYHQWYDLTREAFVRLIAPDGTQRWTWHAPGRITHLPVVSPTGVIYVGAEQRLWAFAVDSAFAERVERP